MPFDVDLSGLAELLSDAAKLDLASLAEELKDEAVGNTRSRLDLLIYSQPERGYERTGKLRESIHGEATADANGLTVTVASGPGAKDRQYGLYNERGTYGSRVELDRIIADARASADPLALPAYPRAKSGLEARSFVIPALAETERYLGDQVLELIERQTR